MLTPDVVALPGGGYRMYYTLVGPGVDYTVTQGNILSAVSDDGERWTKEAGVRVGPHEPEAGLRVVCPDVVPLPDGGYRMYFEAQPPDRPARIASARSADGLTWEPEPGVRFGADNEWRYGSPRAVPLPDGRWRLYFHRYTQPLQMGLDAGNHIVSAISVGRADVRGGARRPHPADDGAGVLRGVRGRGRRSRRRDAGPVADVLRRLDGGPGSRPHLLGDLAGRPCLDEGPGTEPRARRVWASARSMPRNAPSPR